MAKKYIPTQANKKAFHEAVAIFGNQADLARAIGISKSKLSDWKHDRAWMSYETAAKIEKATKGVVTIKSLLNREWKP